jgi:hypothetical protein
MNKENQDGSESPKRRSTKERTKQQLTFNLLLLRLESLTLALDCLPQADDRGALLLEGPTLVLVRDAECDHVDGVFWCT